MTLKPNERNARFWQIALLVIIWDHWRQTKSEISPIDATRNSSNSSRAHRAGRVEVTGDSSGMLKIHHVILSIPSRYFAPTTPSGSSSLRPCFFFGPCSGAVRVVSVGT